MGLSVFAGSMSKSRFWTNHEVQQLREAYSGRGRDRIRLTDLARSMGRTTYACCRKAMDLGLTKRQECPKLDIQENADFINKLRAVLRLDPLHTADRHGKYNPERLERERFAVPLLSKFMGDGNRHSNRYGAAE